MMWLSSVSYSDEELINEMARRVRCLRKFWPRPNHFIIWNDQEFFMRFRITKPTFTNLLTRVQGELISTTKRNFAITPSAQVLLVLRFYATGSMLITVGDFGGIHKTTACRIVRKVTNLIARLAPVYIKMPTTPEEIMHLNKNFFRIARFSRVIGAIDCTHVKIQSPGGLNAEVYRNRKGHFSINVQVVCNANLKILDIVARWPGSSHDQTIFANSRIHARFAMGEFGNQVVLGDSGYAKTKYVMTPLANPFAPEEQLYNEAQIRSRNPIERLFGVYKRRFPILSIGMRLALESDKAIIIATAVLHNICIDMGERLPPVDPDVIVPPEDVNLPDANNVGGQLNDTRRAFINYFRNLL